MISAVAEMYDIHPQTLRLYEREGLLKPSRTEGNTRLYTDEDLQRLGERLECAGGVQVGAGLEGVFALEFEERADLHEDVRNFAFVHDLRAYFPPCAGAAGAGQWRTSMEPGVAEFTRAGAPLRGSSAGLALGALSGGMESIGPGAR